MNKLKELWLEKKKEYSLDFFLDVLKRYKRIIYEFLLTTLFLQIMGIGLPLITQVIIDKVLSNKGYSTLMVIGVSTAIFFSVQALLTGLRTYIMNNTSMKLDAILGARIYHQLLGLPMPYYQNRAVGDVVFRVNMISSIREFFTGTALTTVLDIFFSVVFITFMLWYSVPLTLIALLAVPFYIFQAIWAFPISREKNNEMFKASIATSSFMTEAVTGMEAVKALAVEPQFRYHWEQLIAHYVGTAFDNAKFNLVINTASNVLKQLASLLVLWFGGHMVMNGEFTLGQLIAFQMISNQALTPLTKLLTIWPQLQRTAMGLLCLSDIINKPIEPVLINKGKQADSLRGKIQLKDITFRYRPDLPPILTDFNLEIQPGQRVGIVGRSGSGKSTLANLLQLMYLPQKGQILYDDIPVEDISLGWLRSKIGIVTQENYLFNSSIRDNIVVSRPDAPMEQVIQAAKIAGAHEFILELKEGYDTKAGERGTSLSGGQRQRIAIARAILDNPSILIFDEATSALDYESESLIMRNLDAISTDQATHQRRTMLIIAHRLSTIQRCDRIIVMDKGTIIESGTHAELMSKKGHYHKLYTQQQKGELES